MMKNVVMTLMKKMMKRMKIMTMYKEIKVIESKTQT